MVTKSEHKKVIFAELISNPVRFQTVQKYITVFVFFILSLSFDCFPVLATSGGTNSVSERTHDSTEPFILEDRRLKIGRIFGHSSSKRIQIEKSVFRSEQSVRGSAYNQKTSRWLIKIGDRKAEELNTFVKQKKDELNTFVEQKGR